MSAESKIEWTDSTWNPVRGCTKISPGCAHCYAETFAERFRGVKGHPYEQGFDLRLVRRGQGAEGGCKALIPHFPKNSHPLLYNRRFCGSCTIWQKRRKNPKMVLYKLRFRPLIADRER